MRLSGHQNKRRVAALLSAAAVVLGLLVAPVAAQNITSERVAFARGTTGATISGRITGDEIIDYVLSARLGQRMTVSMSTNNPSAYFNVTLTGAPQAIHIGSSDGNRFSGSLPANGDWRIRVYLIRAAARRGESANFTVQVSIGEGGSGGGGDFADGDSGGPDWWQVANADALNVRAGPGTGYSVVGRATRGQRLRNLGCQSVGVGRWCRVENEDGNLRGWVSGAYLREAGDAVQLPGGGSDFIVSPGGPDWWRVTGVAANDRLNIRTGPGASFRIVASVPNGQVLRNAGVCRGSGSSRWCQVETPDGRAGGWASGRFLTESQAPTAAGGSVPDRNLSGIGAFYSGGIANARISRTLNGLRYALVITNTSSNLACTGNFDREPMTVSVETIIMACTDGTSGTATMRTVGSRSGVLVAFDRSGGGGALVQLN